MRKGVHTLVGGEDLRNRRGCRGGQSILDMGEMRGSEELDTPDIQELF